MSQGRSARLALFVLLPLFGGCAPEPEPPSDPELREALALDDATPIHRIDLSGRGAENRILPPRTEIRQGDVVQFVVLDRRVHHVRFLTDSLSAPAVRFLERTRQLASPPLANRGDRYVLSFADAPPGTYPFVVEGHGEATPGWIHVDGR